MFYSEQGEKQQTLDEKVLPKGWKTELRCPGSFWSCTSLRENTEAAEQQGEVELLKITGKPLNKHNNLNKHNTLMCSHITATLQLPPSHTAINISPTETLTLFCIRFGVCCPLLDESAHTCP